ncbi:translation initiation factor IF-2 subunit beta [archaeon]|nr:MAG: translation initiation factor IF-2 subunit beta [archaeon]RLG65704.1 MAG: translation initiation factor IF-2 subunit beta [archaeon]HDM23551.1 translation initiation factor IF-2 subunit beta [Candidatus Bathyarchaeota archaeon]
MSSDWPYTYEEMLERAHKNLPPKIIKRERFEVPGILVYHIGKRTFIKNFQEICEKLNRDPRIVLRYVLKEIASAGSIERGQAVIQGIINPRAIASALKRFIDEYVICHECKRPDTRLVKEKRVLFVVCEACGARTPVRRI